MKNVFISIGGILLLIAITYILQAGFSKNPAGNIEENKKLQVNASFYPLYFFSSQIGGNKAAVYNLTPAGAEPHDYEPSTKEIARIVDGNMLILNGVVEAWGDKIKENVKETKVNVVVVGEDLLTKQLTEEGKVMKDPHVWLNPKLAKKEVEKITEGYIKIDPANTTYYKNNEIELINKLDQLDSDFKNGLANCQSKDIITSHAAFAYLAEQYGLNQVAITGLSPEEEPTAQQLADVASFAKKNNVKYIFFESLISPKLSETIAKEVGAKTLVLDPIEGISENNIKEGKNYFTVMEDNLKNLQTALQCNK